MKKLPLTLLGAAAVANPVLAEDHISQHYLNYQEHDGRIKAQDHVVSLEKSFGLDWTLNAELGYDSVSGASPSWGPTTPVSGVSDAANRRNATQEAQNKTNQVIRRGYDPHVSGYQVQKYALEDTRRSYSLNLTYRDELRNEWTLGQNYSKEEDYKSFGVNGKGLIFADSHKNRSYSLGASMLFDQTLAFQKFANNTNTQKWENIFTGNIEAGLSQVFSPSYYMVFTGYAGFRDGYLSNHYLTVLREIDINNNGKIGTDEVFLGQDSRPDQRLSGGVNIQAFWAINDSLTVRPRYKWFQDDWGVTSHQIGGKLSWEATNWLTLAPGYFWYNQDGADFFRDPNGKDKTFAATGHATSDLRLGDFTANSYELGASFKVHKKVNINLLGAYYKQSNGFKARWWAVGVSYAF